MIRPPKRVPYEDIERQLTKIFHDLLFAPVMEIIKRDAPKTGVKLENALESPIIEALTACAIQYENGAFSGNFTSAISRALRGIGARFDSRSGVYRLDPAQCPGNVRAAAALAKLKAKEVHEALKTKLNEVARDLNRVIEASVVVDAGQTVEKVDAGFKAMAKELEISPRLSTDARARLAADYNQNMKLRIRDFSENEIQNLRAVVEGNAMQGYRFDALERGIRNRYSVTQSKATFLARQETGLFMAKHRRERYGEAGVMSYVWSTSHDERVRHESKGGNHLALDGRTFSYREKAPATFMSCGKPCNPGEDFNCRCVDIPVVAKKWSLV